MVQFEAKEGFLKLTPQQHEHVRCALYDIHIYGLEGSGRTSWSAILTEVAIFTDFEVPDDSVAAKNLAERLRVYATPRTKRARFNLKAPLLRHVVEFLTHPEIALLSPVEVAPPGRSLRPAVYLSQMFPARPSRIAADNDSVFMCGLFGWRDEGGDPCIIRIDRTQWPSVYDVCVMHFANKRGIVREHGVGWMLEHGLSSIQLYLSSVSLGDSGIYCGSYVEGHADNPTDHLIIQSLDGIAGLELSDAAFEFSNTGYDYESIKSSKVAFSYLSGIIERVKLFSIFRDEKSAIDFINKMEWRRSAGLNFYSAVDRPLRGGLMNEELSPIWESLDNLDLHSFQSCLAAGEDINAPDPRSGWRPIHRIAMIGSLDFLRVAAEQPNIRYGVVTPNHSGRLGGRTPSQIAFYMNAMAIQDEAVRSTAIMQRFLSIKEVRETKGKGPEVRGRTNGPAAAF